MVEVLHFLGGLANLKDFDQSFVDMALTVHHLVDLVMHLITQLLILAGIMRF